MAKRKFDYKDSSTWGNEFAKESERGCVLLLLKSFMPRSKI